MAFLETLLVNFAIAAVGFLLRPKPKAPDPGRPRAPKVREGEPLPVLFGRMRVPMRIVREEEVETREIKDPVRIAGWTISSGPTIGYKYVGNFVALFCHGPIHRLTDIIIDGKHYLASMPAQRVLTGVTRVNRYVLLPTYTTRGVVTPGLPYYTDGLGSQWDDLQKLSIYAPTLYTEEGAGGIEGDVWVQFGRDRNVGSIDVVDEGAPNPKWGKFCMARFDGFYFGNTAAYPSIEFVLESYPPAPGNWNGDHGGTAGINRDCPVVSILWSLLTNADWGRGLPEDLLDSDAWYAFGIQTNASQTVNPNAEGLSFLFDQTDMTADGAIAEVLRHVDGVLYTDPSTGLLKPWLNRDAGHTLFGYFSLESLTLLDDSNTVSIEWVLQLPSRLVNEIKVRFMDAAMSFTENTVRAANLASINAHGLHSESMDFMMCSNRWMAQRIADRELRQASTTRGRASIKCNRLPLSLHLGKQFRLTSDDYNLDQRVMRVLSIDYGTPDDPTITIEAEEDVYTMRAPYGTELSREIEDTDIGQGGSNVPPNIAAAFTQNAAEGIVHIIADDPNDLITAVDFKWGFGESVGSDWGPGTYDAGSGVYTYLVALNGFANTWVEYRVTYTSGTGTTSTIEGSHIFTPAVLPDAPQIGGTIGDDNALRVVAPYVSPNVTQVYYAASTTGYPTTTQIMAGTPTTAGSPTQGVDLGEYEAGQTVYIAAISVDADGNQSQVGFTTAVGTGAATDGSSALGQVTMTTSFGNQSDAIDPGTELQSLSYVDADTDILGWVILAPKESGSLTVSLKYATYANFPSMTTHGTTLTLSSAQKASGNFPVPLEVRGGTYFELEVLSATDVTAAVVALVGRRRTSLGLFPSLFLYPSEDLYPDAG